MRIAKQLTSSVTITAEGQTDKECMMQLAPLCEAYRKLAETGEDPDRYTPVGRKSGNDQGTYDFYELIRDDGEKVYQLGIRQIDNHLYPKGLADGWKPKGQQQQSQQQGWD